MILNFIRGFFMALADSVPGVSGGTIAFLLGFYDRFINSLNSIIKGTKKERINALKFLLKLALGWIIGMILAVSILASVFEKGIYNVSSLFLGFIIAAIPIIIIEEKKILQKKYYNIFYTAVGALIVIALSFLHFSGNLNISNITFGMGIYIFIAGMFAISAMLLPGISGSTILLTFGLYIPIITAIKDFIHLDFNGFFLLLIFGCGVITGVLIVLRGVKKMLEKYRSATIYLIIGMMIGSLYAIVCGPTTLKEPMPAMSINDFSIIYFLIGIALILGLQKIKQLKWYKDESKKV